MKRVLFSTFVMLMFIGTTFAQDIITTKDGNDIQAKILEVTNTEIKYKKFNNPDGPTFTLKKSEVLIVRYQNGENEVFNKTPQADYTSTPNTNLPVKEGMLYKEYKDFYDFHQYSPQSYDPYSPGWSGVASFFIPGLGQVICGEWGRGLAYFGGVIGTYLVGTILTGVTENYLPLLVSSAGALTIEIMSIVDATHVAKIKNMYYQDIRGQQANISFGFAPYITYVNIANTSAIGLSFTLNY